MTDRLNAECACGFVWTVAYLPMDLKTIGKVCRRAICPACGTTNPHMLDRELTEDVRPLPDRGYPENPDDIRVQAAAWLPVGVTALHMAHNMLSALTGADDTEAQSILTSIETALHSAPASVRDTVKEELLSIINTAEG